MKSWEKPKHAKIRGETGRRLKREKLPGGSTNTNWLRKSLLLIIGMILVQVCGDGTPARNAEVEGSTDQGMQSRIKLAYPLGGKVEETRLAQRDEGLNPRGISTEGADTRESCRTIWAWDAGSQQLKGQQRGDRRTRHGKALAGRWTAACEIWRNMPNERRHKGNHIGTEERSLYGVTLWKELLTLGRTHLHGKEWGEIGKRTIEQVKQTWENSRMPKASKRTAGLAGVHVLVAIWARWTRIGFKKKPKTQKKNCQEKPPGRGAKNKKREACHPLERPQIGGR